MKDCKYLKIKDTTSYHADVYDHPDYSYTYIYIYMYDGKQRSNSFYSL